MSGDVQPRKRKDKKRKKDELGVEEPRGTAAVLGEGDVFMHSYHEHGTGGHWCAKVIFFSLLAVLITLIGLIILENRGLTELEANSVESRYSGVLEGWLEDSPDDDHHDEHTLELLKQHEDEEDDHGPAHDINLEDDHDEVDHDDDDHDEADHDDDDDHGEADHDDDDDHGEADQDDDDDDHGEADQDDDDDDHGEADQDDDDDDDEEHESAHDDEDDDDVNNQDSDQEESNENDDDDDDEEDDQHLEESNEDNDDEEPDSKNDEDNDDDDLQKVDENDTAEDNDGDDDDDDNLQNDQADDRSVENDDDDDDDRNIDNDENSHEDENDDKEHEEHDEEEGDSEIEVEKLEQEVSDDDAASKEQHTQEVEEDDDKSQEDSTEVPPEDSGEADDDGIEDEEFLEADDEPVVERIVVPKGKPLAEVEDEPTTAKPVDTLADEEEYEKQQEQLRREEAQASHVWLKLIVGGALLVATHAVVSRAVAPRDDTPASEGHASREDTPSMVDRRMTLIPEETAPVPASSDMVEEIFRKYSQVIKSEPPPKQESEDEEIEEEEEVIRDIKEAVAPAVQETEDKELYSDEEEAEEEIVVEKKDGPKQATPIPAKVKDPEPEEEPEEDVPDDVEIIDDEQLEEELEEEEDDEEEISDVDDAELLTRLEAKYGRLPEPERPGPKNKDGGNSIEDEWPGEPADKYWRQQLDEAEQELRQGAWSAAESRVSAPELQPSARAMWTKARALDAGADLKRDNRLLTRAITAYLEVLKLNERLSDAKLREIAHRTLDRIRFRGTYLSAEPVYRLLIRRFPEDVEYRNNMTVSFLMADRADLAEEVIKETLQKWPNDRIALAHHGFILKTKHNRLEEAVEAFQKALEGDVGPATEPRFYYHLGDSLLLLSRFAEAHEVHKRGAKLGHFLSPAQRSLYNVERLKSQPWWNIEETPYLKLARSLEKSWQDILKEGLAAQTLYEKEKEGLKERGEWSQLDLFVRGQEVPGRCKKAPVTCSIVRGEVAAAGCRRGQIKFSSMEAGTHVRPHVGPTNCRLRMHLGLSNTKDTYIRVDQETRQWQVGKVLMFDDSFEHEVWHNGTGTRLVLIVDVWHPALSPAERRDLPPI